MGCEVAVDPLRPLQQTGGGTWLKKGIPADLLFHLDGLLCKLVQGASLALEDSDVGLQQVLPLHPIPSRHGAHQDGHI